MVERNMQEWERHCISEAASSIASQPESLVTGMLLPFQHDGCKTAADTSHRMFCLKNREASKQECFIDFGA